MTFLSVSIPVKKASGWQAETDPDFARAWLDTLVTDDPAELAREIYQALYTVNRQALEVNRRFELLELYAAPVAVLMTSYEAQFARITLPLSPKRRQLAEFLRQLNLEMANGYKCCLVDLQRRLLPWGKKQIFLGAIFRTMHYLGESLLRSYLVYIPTPARVWAELHELYRYATENDWQHERLPYWPNRENDVGSIHERYLQILLLAAANPYQLPQNDCLLVNRFLTKWGTQAKFETSLTVANPASCFLVPQRRDQPPQAYSPPPTDTSATEWRVLNALELARTVHGFIHRLQKGESAHAMALGMDRLETQWLELLQRLIRSWGLVVRREHNRIKRHGTVSLCVGINSLHFFANGQQPFTPPPPLPSRPEESENDFPLSVNIKDMTDEAAPNEDETYVALDEPEMPFLKIASAQTASNVNDVFRIERWDVHDLSPKGLYLSHVGTHAPLRVGDLVGVQRAEEEGRWSAAVVRWLKSPEDINLNMGVELLAARVQPVSLGVFAPDKQSVTYGPALQLPAMNSVHRPATLLVPRGLTHVGDRLMLARDGGARKIYVLKLLERTASIEQVVFADMEEHLSALSQEALRQVRPDDL